MKIMMKMKTNNEVSYSAVRQLWYPTIQCDGFGFDFSINWLPCWLNILLNLVASGSQT